MKFTKRNIIYILIIIIMISFDVLIVKPRIEKVYLNKTLWDDLDLPIFWITTLIVFLLFCFYTFTLLITKQLKLNNVSFKKSFLTLLLILIPSFFFGFLFKNYTEDIILYINSYTEEDFEIEKYSVNFIGPNNILKLYSQDEQIISSTKDLKRIESIRLNQNLKSVYSLNQNDTIKITFINGIFNERYIAEKSTIANTVYN